MSQKPAGRSPAPDANAPQAQVFGTADSQSTRAALRYFKERRVAVHVVDIRRKPMAPDELRRFVEQLGAPSLAETAGRPWRDAGLGHLLMEPDELVARLLADQRLLNLPLVRVGSRVAAGRDEAAWKELIGGSPR